MINLDPGPAERVNGVAYDRNVLWEAWRALAPVVIQAMVTRGGDWDGSSEESLARWLPQLQHVGPAVVHLYSLDRPPADPTLEKISRERLDEMAAAIRKTLPRAEVLVF